MAISQELTVYRGPTTTTTMATRSSSTSLISSRLFTAQTGTAIATELLYRILVEIIQRLLNSFHSFASARMDQLSSFLEQRAEERKQRALEAAAAKAKAAAEKKTQGLGIADEVGKLVEERGFWGGWRGRGEETECPMTGKEFGRERTPSGPPRWVQGVVDGHSKGVLLDRDFWIQTHGD